MTMRKITGFFAFLACGVPFGFLAMYGDYAWHTMLLYLLMLGASAALGWVCGRRNLVPAALAGNGLSWVLSFFCLFWFRGRDTYNWNWYFKIFGAAGTLLLLLLVSLLLQTLFWKHYRKEKWVCWLLYAVLALLAVSLGGGILLLSSLA